MSTVIDIEEIELTEETQDFTEILPRNVLINILSRLESRRSVARVNKKLYEIACELDSIAGIYRAKIDQSCLRFAPAIYASVIKSKRIVSEIFVSDLILTEPATFWVLGQIFKKFHATLQVVTFQNCLLMDEQLFELINYWGNVQELSILGCRINRCNKSNSFIFNLTNLKKLDMSGTVSSAKPDGLEDHIDLLSVLIAVIAQNSPLESFKAHACVASAFPFHVAHLTQLGLTRVMPKDLRITSCIYSQPYLESLDLLNCFVMNDVVTAILGLEELKVLKINLSGITIEAFNSLKSIETLTEIHVSARKCTWVLKAFETPFKNLTSLYINFEELSVGVGAIVILFCNFKHLKIVHVVTNNVKILECIFAGRYLVSTLISCTVELKHTDLVKNNNKFKPKIEYECKKLQSLTIINTSKTVAEAGTFDFLVNFPKLKSLKIDGFKIDDKMFKSAVEHLKHLEHLELKELKKKRSTFLINHSLLQTLLENARKLNTAKIDCYTCAVPDEIEQIFPISEHRDYTLYLSRR